jgi:glycosyltransferase involved in cell wall biosynthesis
MGSVRRVAVLRSLTLPARRTPGDFRVYNEAKHLEPVLAEVRKYADEILVVDDGSTDDTPEILARQTDLHVITHDPNQGYGGALRSAFLFAREQEYDVLVTIDCDGQHEPRLIPELAAAVFRVRQPLCEGVRRR